MRRWVSSTFSTTVTWNSRGRHTIAAADRRVNEIHRGPNTSAECSISGEARAKTSAGPSERPNITRAPTATSASSLTIASSAMAATTPWCRSFASMFRVPNRMVNRAMPAAIQNAIRKSGAASGRPGRPSLPGLPITWKLVVTACSWSAMYGVVPTSAMIVTSAARLALLP